MSDTKLRLFWPDVSTDKGQKMAIYHGAFAACWIAVSYLLTVIFLAYTGKYTALTNAYGVWTIVVGDCIGILFGSFLCWMIWKRESHVGALVVLVWILVEVLYKAALLPGFGSLVGNIFFTFAAINGVRGTLAHRRWLKEREADPISGEIRA